MWNHPRGHVWNVFVRPASSSGATGRSGTPSRQSRGVDPPVQIRRGGRAQRRGCRKTSGFLSRETGISGNFVGRIKGAKCPFDLQFLTWDFGALVRAKAHHHSSIYCSAEHIVCILGASQPGRLLQARRTACLISAFSVPGTEQGINKCSVNG